MNSFKKIALGLAAAMSLGVLTALPTSAAVIAPTLTIDSATDAITAGETATAVVTLSFISETAADTATVLSAMFAQPTGSNKSATLALLETTTSTVAIAAGNLSADVNSTVGTPGYVSELQSRFGISYAVFCLNKKTKNPEPCAGPLISGPTALTPYNPLYAPVVPHRTS